MKIEMGSKNVFRDLGFSGREALELERKANLMSAIEAFIKRNRLTQTRAAEVLEISQPRVSELLNGRMSKFSLDELARLCERIGSAIKIVVYRNPAVERDVLIKIPATAGSIRRRARAISGGAKPHRGARAAAAKAKRHVGRHAPQPPTARVKFPRKHG